MSTAVVRKTKLNRKWTLWEVRQVDYRKQTMSARAYMTGLHAAFTFDCVEDFWRCFNNYPTPRCGPRRPVCCGRCSRGRLGFSAIFGEFKDAKIVKRGEEECVLDGLALFEDGVQPMFEDIKNKNGSEWRFVVVCAWQAGHGARAGRGARCGGRRTTLVAREQARRRSWTSCGCACAPGLSGRACTRRCGRRSTAFA